MLSLKVSGAEQVKVKCEIGQYRHCDEHYITKSGHLNVTGHCFQELLNYHNSREIIEDDQWKSSNNYGWNWSTQQGTKYSVYYSQVSRTNMYRLGQTRNVVLNNLVSPLTLESMRDHPNGQRFNSLHIKSAHQLQPNKGQKLQVTNLRVDKVVGLIELLTYFDLLYLNQLVIGEIIDYPLITPERVKQINNITPTLKLNKLTLKKGNAANLLLSYHLSVARVDIEHFIPFSQTGNSLGETIEKESTYINRLRITKNPEVHRDYLFTLTNRIAGGDFLFPHEENTVKTKCSIKEDIDELRVRGVFYTGFYERRNYRCKLQKLILGPKSYTFNSIFTGRTEHLVIEVLVENDKLTYNNTELNLNNSCQVKYLLVKPISETY